MRLLENIYAYTWGSAFYDSSNSYVIVDGEAVLIDPGTYKSYTNLFGLLRNDGIEGIDYVLNTHLHKDHCESNQMFMRKGALVGFDERDRVVSQFSYSPDLRLGKVFVVGETEIEVVRTPGHSPGSLTFFVQEHGVAITGDLIFENGIPGRFDLYGSDRREFIRSLERLAGLEPEYLLPGHRRVMKGRKGIAALVEKAIEIIGLY
ncbi:MAG: MBL fold metallo-hydrolase [Archaeoglobi archaeon]|nr:MBL fold metallo-hydrolase [Archaeoglobi archaeon]